MQPSTPACMECVLQSSAPLRAAHVPGDSKGSLKQRELDGRMIIEIFRSACCAHGDRDTLDDASLSLPPCRPVDSSHEARGCSPSLFLSPVHVSARTHARSRTVGHLSHPFLSHAVPSGLICHWQMEDLRCRVETRDYR